MKGRLRNKSISILLLLFVLTTLITYFPVNVVVSQIVIYSIIAIIYIISPKVKRVANMWYTITLIICFLLLFRIIVDLELLGIRQELYGSNTSLYFFIINGIILPVTIIPRLRLGSSNIKKGLLISSVVILVCLIISLLGIVSSQAALSNDGRFSANDSLGVIQYSQLAFTCSLIGLSLLYGDEKNNLIVITYAILLIIIGLISVILAGTRSCFVSMAIILVFLFIAHKPKNLFKTISITSIIIIVLGFIVFKSEYSDTIEGLRLFRLLSGGARDVSSGRFDLFESALKDIIANPVLGYSAFFSFSDGIDDMTFIHNSVLEVARAIGVMGGLFFLFMNIYLLFSSYKIMKYHRQYSIFVFLFIQYFVFSLFSESVFRIALYWYSTGMVFCLIKIIKNESLSIKSSVCDNTDIWRSGESSGRN